MLINTVISIIKNAAPLLALLATAVRTIPTILISLKARSRSRTSSLETIRVDTFRITAPWHNNPWPSDWASKQARVRYRRKERFWIKVLFATSLILATFYGSLLYDDRFKDFIPFHSGNGIPAGLACAGFLAICFYQARFYLRIRGELGLGDTLYGAEGKIVTSGNLADVRQYCLGALYDIGSKLVSSVECIDADGCPRTVQITAATGLWPPKWLSFGALQLVSFRGEKVTVLLSSIDGSRWSVHIRSDNMDPGVDEGSRSNARNVRAFIETWSFFPGNLVGTTRQ